MGLSRVRVWALLVVIVLVGAFFRFYNLGRESLWDGEIFTLLFAQYDWSILAQSVSTFSAHPPLWFALTKAVIAGGWNETLLRMPAVFAGILSVPAVFVLGKRLVDVRVGLLTAGLLAISPLDVIFSQNARNYAFFVLLTVLLLYAVVRATEQRQGTARWWVLFVAAGLAGLYTHYLFVLPLAGTVLAVMVRLIVDAARKAGSYRIGAWWGLALASSRWFLVALIALVALYLPWTPTVGSAFLDRQLTRESANEEGEAGALTIEDAPRLLKDLSGNPNWGLGLMAGLAVVGMVWSWRTNKRAPLFWFGIAILLPILVTVLLAPRRLPAKYLIYVLPAYLMFVSYGVIGICELLRQTALKSERATLAVGAVFVGLMAVAMIPNMPYWNGKQEIFTGKGWAVVDAWKPWREAAASVTARAAPGDLVMFPQEARALTARSVVPYFENAFLEKLYNAPLTGKVWWVSDEKDVEAGNAPLVRDEQRFGSLVVQELVREPNFVQVVVPNAGFEDGLDGWVKSGEALVWSTDKATAQEGERAGQFTMSAPSIVAMRSAEFPVTPGMVYRVTALVKNPTIGFYTVSPQLYANFTSPTNRPPRRTRLATLVPTADPEWVMMVADGVVPEDATSGRVEFIFREYANALGPTSWIDDVRVWVEK